MIHTRATLRSTLVEVLLSMGEITEDQGATLVASLDNDVDLARLNFDSLTLLDFCLKVETKTEIIVNPDELVELASLRGVEALILAKQAR